VSRSADRVRPRTLFALARCAHPEPMCAHRSRLGRARFCRHFRSCESKIEA
jgi:hypothetical protein